MESNEHLLTPRELSKLFSMSLPWVYKATERGDLPYLRIGQAIRFDPQEIKVYLETRRNLKGGKDGN
jgi:excisionase family DNA binding protein